MSNLEKIEQLNKEIAILNYQKDRISIDINKKTAELEKIRFDILARSLKRLKQIDISLEVAA